MKALIAMSGGVDSSMAADLTMKAGYECIGCTMKLFENQTGSENDGAETRRSCSSPDEVNDAQKIADKLGIPYYLFDYKEAFRSCVMDKFAESYASGMTPNPCIDCNRELKFGRLLQKAEELGCEYIVTGHYARIERDEETGLYQLKKGLDPAKDQSYVLYQLTQEQLAHVLLPLGELTKQEVREMAEAAGFVNANRPDSEDICFIPDGTYAEMIENHLGRSFPPGEFVDMDGTVIGEHRGIIHYTIGQRKHLGQTFGTPKYVCGIDAEHNRVMLGGPDDVFSSYVKAVDFNWTSGIVPEGEIRCKVRLRYQQKEQWASVRADGCGGADIFFDKPQRAVTPGQAAVLYDDDIVLGGGTIVRQTEPADR